MRKVYNGGKWTEARFHAFVTSVLRAGSRRWEPKYQTLNAAKTEKKINVRTGRVAQHYRCNACSQEFPAKEIQVDHKKPIVSKKGFVSWDAYIDALFCEQRNLQALCKACHKEKTLKERQNKE